MTWVPHIEMLQKRVASAVWALHQLKNLASQTTLRSVYFGLIHSKLQYCISSWGAASPSNLNKLKALQKRAIRTICRAHYLAHTTGLFKKQSILKLEDLHTHSVAVVVSRYKHGRWQGNFCPTSTAKIHSHDTRRASNNNLYLPRATNEVFKRSLSYQGPRVWAAVPKEIKVLDTPALKVKLKRHFLALYDDQEVDQLSLQHSV